MSTINSVVLDMWLLKFMTRGQNFGNISDNRFFLIFNNGFVRSPSSSLQFYMFSPFGAGRRKAVVGIYQERNKHSFC